MKGGIAESDRSAATPGRWRLVGASIAGSSHEIAGVLCQDSHVLAVVDTTAGHVLISIVADGAGSASLSGRGSRLACDTAREAIERYIVTDPALTRLTDDQVHRWIDECAMRLEETANVLDVPVRELACTLLVAVIGETRACFAQLGDGAIVIEHAGVLDAITWPQNGEFANTTLFITDPKDRAELQVEFVEGLVGEVALLTDGVELLALRLREHRPHAPFFASMFESVRSLELSDVAEAETSLGDFLSSDRVRARTDDDLTLVLASRRPPGTPFTLRPPLESTALTGRREDRDQLATPAHTAKETQTDAATLTAAEFSRADRQNS